jgi:ABC-type antimicrobial peptide transport system permease subunit
LGSALFQVELIDPVTFVGIALILVATGVVACLIPALRARQVDPIVALRVE